MKKIVAKFLSSLVVLLGLLFLTFGPTAALKNTPATNLPLKGLLTPTVTLPVTGDVFPFSQLISNDITLVGPYQSDSVSFAVPPSWQLTSGAQLNLFLTVAFNNVTADLGTAGVTQGAAGTLTITLNNIVLGVISLDQVGDKTYQYQISPEALIPVNPDGIQELRFSLDAGWSCYVNQSTTVIIRTSSLLTLPHTNAIPDTNLIAFPSPIYQDYTLFKIPALVVLPDNPTASEIQAAFTLGAGLGNITAGKLNMDLTTISMLTSDQIASMNLILVGRAATINYSSQLKFPLPVTNGKFENSGGNPDDGIVEMVNSPWAADKVVLIVSGNTDQGVVKAAQAVSTGKLRPNLQPNVAVIDRVSSTTLSALPSADQTFKDLGYKDRVLSNAGTNYAFYHFIIPPGQTISEGAYLDLYYGHSAMLQFENSGMVVLLNGTPIGSITLTKDSALQAINHAQITIPSSIVLAGDNLIELRVILYPVDKCTRPQTLGIYANIWADSMFHLPLQASPVTGLASNYDLKMYPAPFSYDSTLRDTAFVLQKNDIQSWKDAFNVAVYLGDRSAGSVSMPAVFFADNLPQPEKANYNFIVIGQPSQLPIIQELNNVLPAPFEGNADVVKEPPMQVMYRINPGATIGYVEMAPSPWNKDKIVVTALGNNIQGVTWASSHLIEPASWKLAGNFATINDQQVFTADTRVYALATNAQPGGSGPSFPENVATPSLIVSPPVPYHPGWLVPTLVGISLLIVITIIIAISLYLFRNRRKPKKISLDNSDSDPKE